MKCPRCGADESGAFCGNCGADLAAVGTCRRCGGNVPSGARFCIRCGARVGGNAMRRWALPAAIAVLALVAGYWLGDRGDTAMTGAGGTTPEMTLAPAAISAGDGADGSFGSPPPLTGTLREQADRLFERIMQARARGDTAEARFFLPMALQAYEGVDGLDADGLLHLGLLQLSAGSTDEAAATARRIVEQDPGHLFGLALTAQAAIEAGDETAARAAFTEFLTRYDDEIARGRPEYDLHAPAIEEYRSRALEITGE